jgi:hypothetical protein
MRPQKADLLINKMFRHLDYKGTDLTPVKVALPAIKKALEKSIQDDKRFVFSDDEVFIEANMYYEESLKEDKLIMGNLYYIQDRWLCTGRLKFLLAVAEKTNGNL